MDTPSQVLAAKIVGRLVEEGLLTKDAAKKVATNLSEGKLRSEDWRLLLELDRKKEGKS